MSDSESKENDDEDKENMDESRADTSMTNSTLNTTSDIHRVVNVDANIDSNGLLDLSKSSITDLNTKLCDEYATVTHLNISNNSIRHFKHIKYFKKCQTINAEENEIRMFSSSSNTILKEVYFSHNQLTDAACFNHFINITILDLSYNNLTLEKKWSLNLPKLTNLNLKENNLYELPDISKCTDLQKLDISMNKISDLTSIQKCVSHENLEMLDISNNIIDDLSQFGQLAPFNKITQISVARNPGIDRVETIDYRLFIIAVVYNEGLQTIDGQTIDDDTRNKGEWLYMQRNIRSIEPGNHDELCKKIESHFPSGDQTTLTPAQKTCKKVLLKKRESDGLSQNNSDRESNSSCSAYQKWTNQMRNKLNFISKCDINMDEEDEESIKEEKMARRHTTSDTKYRDVVENVQYNEYLSTSLPGSTNSSFVYGCVGRSSSDGDEFVSGQASKANSIDSTHTVVISSSARTEASITTVGDSVITPTPKIEEFRSVSAARSDANSDGSSHHRKIPSVAEISIISDDKYTMLEKKVERLEEVTKELLKQNKHLTDTNEVLMSILEDIGSQMKKSIPTPQNLRASEWVDKTDGSSALVLRWDINFVRGYEIYADGVLCGEVTGRTNSARICDLAENMDHKIQIRAIGTNGVSGEFSEEIQTNF